MFELTNATNRRLRHTGSTARWMLNLEHLNNNKNMGGTRVYIVENFQLNPLTI